MTETAELLRGRFAGVDLDALVDWRVVRTWLLWGMFWLMVTPTVGAIISTLFNYPDFLGTTHLQLTFGRLRPVH
ncbi:MAG: cytochrome oxidase, partial [Methylovirgula sp.]